MIFAGHGGGAQRPSAGASRLDHLGHTTGIFVLFDLLLAPWRCRPAACRAGGIGAACRAPLAALGRPSISYRKYRQAKVTLSDPNETGRSRNGLGNGTEPWNAVWTSAVGRMGRTDAPCRQGIDGGRSSYARVVRIVMDVDGDGDVVSRLEFWLLHRRQDLAGTDIRRGRAGVRPGDLGGAEVLEFLANEVSLPLLLAAVYDFFRDRRRSRPAEKTRVTLTRTDLPDGTRTVTLSLDASPESAIRAARQALEAFSDNE